MKAPVLIASLTCTLSCLSADVKTAPKPQPNPAAVVLASPCYSAAFDFCALFLKPSSGDLHYAAQATPLPAPSPNWKIHEIHPEYHFAFDIGGEVALHKTNSNLLLDWLHFHSVDTASVSVPASQMLGPFFTIGPNAAPYDHSHGKAHYKFDAIDLDFGMLMHLGDRFTANLFGGVTYAYIKQTVIASFSDPEDGYFRSIRTPSRFSGAGPQMGLNATFRMVEGFHLTGGLKAALLFGSMTNHTTYNTDSPEIDTLLHIPPPNIQRTSVSRRTQMVPGLEGNLGLAYTYTFCKHYILSLEAGYETLIYISAIQSTDMGSEVPLTSTEASSTGVYARTFQRTLSNFTLAGPYATLTFGF